MASVELNLLCDGDTTALDSSPAMLLALVDALQTGTLNEYQRDALSALRAGLLSLAPKDEGEASMHG